MDRPAIESIWRYGYFQLAVGLPILGCILLSGYVAYGDNLSWAGWNGGSEALALFWQHFKVPLAVLSLAVPLGAWAIADKRNRDTHEALKRQSLALEKQEKALQHQIKVFEAQEEKRIQDLYYAKAKYSVDMLGHYVEQMPNGRYFSEGSLTLLFESLFGKPNVSGLWPLSTNDIALKEISSAQLSLDQFLNDYGSHFKKLSPNAEANSYNGISNEPLIELLEKLQQRLGRILDCACIPRDKYPSYIELLQIPMAFNEVLEKIAQVTQQEDNPSWPKLNVLSHLFAVVVTKNSLEAICEDYGVPGSSIDEIKESIESHDDNFS